MTHRFVLEGVDPDTNCIARDVTVVIEEPARLAALLDIEPGSFSEHVSYPVESEQLEQLTSELGIVFDAGELEVWVRTWGPLDGLPYKVHTNRELALMLEGSKPFAVFDAEDRDVEGSSARFFEEHVASGHFISRAHTFADGRQQVFYAQPTEAWRFDAYIQLWESVETTGWSEEAERRQGTLLGYEAWQNDIYIETIYRRNRRDGCKPTG